MVDYSNIELEAEDNCTMSSNCWKRRTAHLEHYVTLPSKKSFRGEGN